MVEISDFIFDIMVICYSTILSVSVLYKVYVRMSNEYGVVSGMRIGRENIAQGEILPRATFSYWNPKPIDFSSNLGTAVGPRRQCSLNDSYDWAWYLSMHAYIYMYIHLCTYIYIYISGCLSTWILLPAYNFANRSKRDTRTSNCIRIWTLLMIYFNHLINHN